MERQSGDTSYTISENSLNKPNLSFAKIVSTPQQTAWSQAYNAGVLFAVLSLEKESLDDNEEQTLGTLGKEIFNRLEEEYFTLENKNLSSIKQAIIAVKDSIPKEVAACLAIVAILPSQSEKHHHILYAFSIGKCSVILVRKGKIGVVVPNALDIASASGYLHDQDIVVLETQSFSQIIPHKKLIASLEHKNPEETAEALAPIIHQREEGSACAILISYKSSEPLSSEELQRSLHSSAQKEEEMPKEMGNLPIAKFDFSLIKIRLDNFLKTSLAISSHLTHPRKISLTIAVILVVVFFTSIYLAIKKQEDSKNKALFQQTYTQALQKYEEGQGLLELNKNLARDYFLGAQTILEENKSQFTKGSQEEGKVLELLEKVNKLLELSSQTFLATTTQVSETLSILLSTKKKKADLLYITQNENTVYGVSQTYITSTDKKNQSEKQIIANQGLWKEAGGISIYNGYLYLLDKETSQIYKFAPDSFSLRSNYFPTDSTPNLSNATSFAIDGSIYILSLDGLVQKFLRGKAEVFTISGLDKPLLKPTRIYTDADTNNIYILDNGNSRIVIFDKKGAYQSQYGSEIITSAEEVEVREKEKKILVLSKGKIYEVLLR